MELPDLGFFLIDWLYSQNYIGPMPNDSADIENILGPHGLLSRALPGFEFRPSQLEMAILIQEAIEQELPTLVEAGTGTGKTFGYLVPIILSGKKTVISTGTKNLQEQIYFKDLPLLQKAVHFNINAMIMKGRKNYLCLHKYHQHFAQSSLFKAGPAEAKERLDKWLKKTALGDRAELPWLSDDDPLWDALSSTSDQCQGIHCMFQKDCYLSRLRTSAARAQIIIVNHHLFFSDLKVKKSGFGEIIPRFQVALFDEAHNVEEIGTSYLGESLSTNQLSELVIDLEKGLRGKPNVDKGKLKKHLNNIKLGIERLKTFFDGRDIKGRLEDEVLSELKEGPAQKISQALRYVSELGRIAKPDSLSSESAGMQKGASDPALAARAAELNYLLDEILWNKDAAWLNWYEKRKKSLVLYASPLDISESMNELVYQKTQTTIFTSATLSTNGNFDYIRSRLDLPADSLEGLYPSHFDFKTQTLMYIPKDLPVPNAPDFGARIAQRISEIIESTQGRALVLFTSYHNLNIVWNILKDNVSYPILRQGDAPRSVLLDSFRTDVNSILLGTASFWQGVDVPGESLSCLIVDKLPFDSPGEPLVAARIDAIRDQAGNPFMDYQVPSAIITFKQGMGRLIRKSSDKGVLSVLDNRILTSRYGRLFLGSLPKSPLSHDLSDIRKFLAR
jgi:ATP-dependent DNA helicase DinG